MYKVKIKQDEKRNQKGKNDGGDKLGKDGEERKDLEKETV